MTGVVTRGAIERGRADAVRRNAVRGRKGVSVRGDGRLAWVPCAKTRALGWCLSTAYT